MAEAEGFWAVAYFAPLHATLGRWHAACEAPRRFVYALREWWPVLVDGTDAAAARSARPRCVPPWGEEAWLAQRAVLLYLCHTPYCVQGVPRDAQPFLPLVEAYAARSGHAWQGVGTRDHAFLAAVVRALLAGRPDDVREMTPCAARGAWDVPAHVRAAPLAAFEASRAAALLMHNDTAPLDLVRQAWLQQYWCRMRRRADAESTELMAAMALRDTSMHGLCLPPALAASLAPQHAGLAAEWVLCTCRLPRTHLPAAWTRAGLWEQLGEALAHDTAHVRAAGDMLVLLVESDERVSTCLDDGTDAELRVAWLVQRVCVPRFLAVLATVMEGEPRDDLAEFVCRWTLRLVHKGYLPLPRAHVADQGEVGALEARANDELDMLDAVLRSAALRYARHAYASALYQALTHGPGEHVEPTDRRGGSARAFLLLQVGVRLLTFVLNQVLVRTVSPAVFGAANVQLELVLSIVLSLARDGVRAVVVRRQAALRAPATVRALHNLALLPVFCGGVLAAAVGAAYLRYMAPPALWAQGGSALPVSVALYGLGALFELMAEPLHTRALGLPQYVRVRIGMEAGGVLVRALVHVLLLQPVCLAWLRRHGAAWVAVPPGELPWALLAFALARAAYGAACFGVASVMLARLTSVRCVVAAQCPRCDTPLFDTRETRALVRVTTAQAVLKLALTEGDKLALTKLTSLAHQGGYALASNYGSILARTLYQPLEESARLQFTRDAGPEAGRAATLLQVLLRVHVLLGAALVAFGPPLARAALRLVAGARWAEPPSPAAPILATYCWYLPVMGVNGLVEAFVQAVAPPAVLASYSRVLVMSSAMFVLVLYGAHGVGLGGAESAIVWANIAALGLRAGASYRYVRRYFASTPCRAQVAWRALVPRARTLGALAACAAVLRSRAVQAQSGAAQLGLGVALASIMYVVALTSSLGLEWRTCTAALAVLR
ncbi:Oligosaccharide translocation protein rft1 [Malassezia caprae]|uniref:Man(5)GlcNAc(2)-PP-dolichol translocation protein RFT1 n=1 Tax=Malassezia caprae TaxID=1381934 RepID=A0AAF0E4V0_9BASI|nr:Oligosaccharide translocation protein rft1 [Malassezia caprae]